MASFAWTAKVRLLVYRYSKCAPPSIYCHADPLERDGFAFALRILGILQLLWLAVLQSKNVDRSRE